MTRTQLDHFRRRLEAERDAMEARSGADRSGAAAETAHRDDVDEAVRDADVDGILRIGELRTHRREEIDDALLRIAQEEYGRCEDCGRPIEIERLEAMPEARFCLDDTRRRESAPHSSL